MTKVKNTPCAICRKKGKFDVIFKENFTNTDVNSATYVSRRIPDNIHFRIVRCIKCGLIYSNPILNPKMIVNSYKNSEVPLLEDLENSSEVYAHYLNKIMPSLKSKGRLLDIGCGNGFFMKKAKELGFTKVYGVEPSRKSVNHLAEGVNRKNIVVDVFKGNLFPPNYFDAICFFQVLDHVIDPNIFLKECYKTLKPGGYVLAIMHDVNSTTARVLGSHSPIFDIQHIYLYDKKTVKEIFVNNKFKVESVFNTHTKYSLGYWISMAPIPSFIKNYSRRHKRFGLFGIKIPMRVGNMAIVAKK